MAQKVLAILVAFLYSIAYAVVGPVIMAQDVHFDASSLLPFALCFVLSSAFNLLLVFLSHKIAPLKINDRINRFVNRFSLRTQFIIVWAFIFVLWIPAYLILFPGVLSYDILSQIHSALTTIVDNHHPILHTWLLRVFMQLGKALFSRYEYGIGILSLLQMILLSYSLTRLVFLLKKKKVPAVLVTVTAVISALWFMNAVLAVTMIKDTLHVAFFLLFICHFTEIATNPADYVSRKRNLFLFPVITFLMCALRNNGLHILLFCILFLLLLRLPKIREFKKAYIPLIAVIMLPVILFKIYTGPVFSALNIEQGEIREALCLPIQQIQRVSALKYDELSEDRKEQIRSYLIDCADWAGYPNNRAYLPFHADPAKGCFYSAYYLENKSDFWKFYISLGKQYPQTYVVAALSNTLGYWYPGYYEYSFVMYEDYPAQEFEKFEIPLGRMSLWDSASVKSIYKSLCEEDFWRTTPVLRLFFVPGFALWLLLLTLVLAWNKKGFFTKRLPMFLPLIAQFGIMLLCPVASFRYSWPFYLILPLTFIGIWGQTETKNPPEYGE